MLAGIGTCGDRLSAQDRRQNAPGEFDFYVLSLSWSPSFCEAAGERGKRRRSSNAASGRSPSWCTGCGRNTSSGFPEFCQRPSPRLDRNIMTSMLDLMPAPRADLQRMGQARHLLRAGARAYFETIRKARAAVKIPDELSRSSEPKTVAPDEIEDAFVKANPGLSAVRRSRSPATARGSAKSASA